LKAGIFSYKHKVMTLKQVFIKNLKEFRKKEGLSQMKLAEYCNTAPSYIGQIETGLRFPSLELVEKMADILRIEPYHFFKKRGGRNDTSDTENIFPLLPNSMKKQISTQIKTQLDRSTNEILSEILSKY
jgi:transcriptional regulator with XRE-family HTH domain